MLAHGSHNRLLGRLVHWGALDRRGGGGRGALCQPFHLPYSNEDYGYKGRYFKKKLIRAFRHPPFY